MTVEGSRWKSEAKGPLEKRATVSSGKENGSEDQRPEEMGVAGLLQETLQENRCERTVVGTEAGHAWGPRGTGAVARVTSTLGLGHHSPASARWDTSEREAGVVRWLQARATRGRRCGVCGREAARTAEPCSQTPGNRWLLTWPTRGRAAGETGTPLTPWRWGPRLQAPRLQEAP